MPGLPPHHKKNFQTLAKAIKNDDVCIMDCFEKATKRPVALICIVERKGDDYTMMPVAKMLDMDKVFDDYIPPSTTDNGYSNENIITEERHAEGQDPC